MKKGWETKTLGDIADIKGGKRVPKGYKLQTETTDHPYITVSDFTDDGTIDASGIRYVSNRIFEQIKRYTISSKDLYLSIAGTIGKTGFVPFELDGASLTENACKLVLRPGIDRDYVYYFTKSEDFEIQAGTNTRTAAQPKLALERLKTITLPIPASRAEQRRIVGILDEAFEGIAIAKADAEKNLQNAHDLFESHLHSVFTQRGEGWVQKNLGDVCSIARGGSPRPIKKFLTTATDGINWIKIGDATVSGKYIYRTEEKIIPEGARRSRVVYDGDFLLSNSMSFGRPYIMRTTGCIHDGWLVLSDYASHLDQDYLYYILGSQLVFQQFDRLAAGSTVRNLNIDLASRVEIPIPPLKQQREIAEQLDAISAETQRLESIYRRKLAALKALKKSLLNQAFTGEL